MELRQLVATVLGAFFGSMGWLLVGLFLSRRASRFVARNAARAVYFELDLNRVSVGLARDYGTFTPLSRSAYERLLPELATILGVKDLSVLAAAYMAHIGYEQMRQSREQSSEAREAALSGILAAQERALASLRGIAFTAPEQAQLATVASGDTG